MKHLKNITQSLILTTSLLADRVYAADWTLTNSFPGAGLTLQDFVNVLLGIIQLVAIPALAVAIIYGGFLLVTAGGDETQMTKAKQWILWSLVGGVIILGAKVISGIVFGTASQF